MQSKIIDFASDKIVNSLQKIDKNDVRKVMTSISDKMTSKSAQRSKEHPSVSSVVTSSETYCAMVQNEFSFEPHASEDDRQRSILKQNSNYDTNLTVEEPYATGDMRNDKYDDYEKSYHESLSANAEQFSELYKPEVTKQYRNEVLSFVQKKNVAQGMMDLALLSSNCNQLRYVLDMNSMHPYYLTSLILIGTSLALQVIVGLGLLYQNSYNLKRQSGMQSANKFSNLSVIGVFFITIINVLISTFNGTNMKTADAPSNLTTTTEQSVFPWS